MLGFKAIKDSNISPREIKFGGCIAEIELVVNNDTTTEMTLLKGQISFDMFIVPHFS